MDNKNNSVPVNSSKQKGESILKVVEIICIGIIVGSTILFMLATN